VYILREVVMSDSMLYLLPCYLNCRDEKQLEGLYPYISSCQSVYVCDKMAGLTI